jgi:hypothetical protein
VTEEQLPVPRQWVPGQQVSVHPDTAPWLQHPDGRLARLDTFPVFTHLAPGGCGGCREGWVVAPDVDGPHGQGVRACPDCAELDGEFDPDPFESDLHAAAELAERLDPTGTLTVWYTPQSTPVRGTLAPLLEGGSGGLGMSRRVA